LTSSFSCAAVSNASLRVKLLKMMAIFENVNAIDLPTQYIIRIVSSVELALIF